MMNTWMGPDSDGGKKKNGRGGRQQSGFSSAMNPSWNSFQGGYGSQGGYGAMGGYGAQGGYGFGGGSW